MSHRLPRALARSGVALLLLVVAALLAVTVRWMAVAGPGAGLVGIARLLKNGPTTVDDYRRYPARLLLPTTRTAPLPSSGGAEPAGDAASMSVSGLGGFGSLRALLDGTGTVAFVVVQDGSITLERYLRGGGVDELSQLFSVSKSITALLVGMAIDDSILAGLDEPITRLVPEVASGGFGGVTLEHLLTMRSGTAYVENDNPFGLHVPLNYTGDIEGMAVRFRAQGPPGEGFHYASGDTALLSLALARALAPETLTSYAQRRLWTPLGLGRGVWTVDRVGGLEKAWCCLAMTARDLATVGQLLLAEGRWGADQLVSSAWIARSAAAPERGAAGWPDVYRGSALRDYGLGWWLLTPDRGELLAFGKDGQFLYLAPAERAAVVRLGRTMGGLRVSEWVEVFRQAVAVDR